MLISVCVWGGGGGGGRGGEGAEGVRCVGVAGKLIAYIGLECSFGIYILFEFEIIYLSQFQIFKVYMINPAFQSNRYMYISRSII